MSEGERQVFMALELVSIQTDDGLQLDGSFRTTGSTGASRLAVDCAILHHGAGLSFYATRFYEVLERSLVNEGCAVVRANNRGHDLIYNGPKGRLGTAYENLDDCRLDWRAWIDFAEQQGFRRILVVGHSLGAVKTIYYLATEEDTRVPCAIAVSPPRFCFENFKSRDGGERFVQFYERAKGLVDAGDPEALIDVDIPTQLIITAHNYVDKYGPADRYDIVKHLPSVRVPILVTIASQEDIGVASPRFPFKGLTRVVEQMAQELPQLSFELVQGADHYYTDRADDLSSAANNWLKRI